MTRIELTVARQYARQATFLALRGNITEARILLLNAKKDTDITEEAFSILDSINDGLRDFQLLSYNNK